MIIVIIHWKIKPEQEKVEEFLEFWRKAALVGDRTGLIGEKAYPSDPGFSRCCVQR